jgi:2,6-dihydroxypseudooxynicotine hydrolase
MIVGVDVAGVHDERIVVALRHWAPRFIANGVDYSDLVRTVSRMRTWGDWLAQWSQTARGYEALAADAESRGSRISAGEAWRRAAMCWHFGKFLFFEDPDGAARAQQRMTACYDRGLSSLEPPGEKVGVPYRGVHMAGILRRPPSAERPPLVIMVPGLDSTKEELQATAEFLLRRGLATLAIDGPGQGETERLLNIEVDSERFVGAAIDFVESLSSVNATRIGLFGVSLGGYYVVRAAAFEPRIRATVENAGPYRIGERFDELPLMTRTALQHRSGAKSADEARARALALDLSGVAALVISPLLVAHGTDDGVVPFSDAERIVAEARNATLARFEHGNHAMSNQAFQMRSSTADWLADQLGD